MRTKIDWESAIAAGACTPEEAKDYADVLTVLDGQAVLAENLWRLNDDDMAKLDRIIDYLLEGK